MAFVLPAVRYTSVEVYTGVYAEYTTCALYSVTSSSWYIYRLYHAVEVYTGMYKTAETGLETRARSARVSKVSKVLCIPVYTDTAWYKVFMPCRCTARARTRAMAPAA